MKEKKYCKFCGESIEKDALVCCKCGRQVETAKIQKEESQTVESKNSENAKFYEQEWFMWIMLILFAPLGIFFMFKFNKRLSQKSKIIISILFAILFLIVIVGNSNNSTSIDDNKIENNGTTSNNNNSTNSNNNNNSSSSKKDHYSFNETFEFDDLEITIGNQYSFTTVSNQYSEHNQKSVVKLPITVKNISNDTHGLNMFYYNVYGSNGTETDTVSSYFDDNIDFAGDLRSGASYTKYLHFLYDGNGTYTIEFKNWTEKITVEFQIQK